MVDISKLTIPLTRDEVKMLWLDLDKEQINKRIGEQGKNQGQVQFPKKREGRTMELIKAGCMIDLTQEKVALHAGISKRTMIKRRQEYGELSETLCTLMEGWRDNMEIVSKLGIRNAIQNGNVQAAIHVVKSKDKRYNPDKINIHGGDVTNVFLGVAAESQQFILDRVAKGIVPIQVEENKSLPQQNGGETHASQTGSASQSS